jgi:hypothetical protein
MQLKSKCWWHHWHYVNDISVPAVDNCGPHHPYPKVTKIMHQYVCCACGKYELKNPPEIYY